LPGNILNQLKIEFVGYESFILANGSPIRLKTFFGLVKIGNRSVETTFIEGDHLLGMAFMTSIADELRVGFKSNQVFLMK
jgi:hypothetical protein